MRGTTTFNDLRKTLQAEEPERFVRLELAGKMKGVRERRALTQVSLSELANVPQKTISRMENGKQTPLEVYSKLAAAMDYTLSFALEDNNSSHSSTD